MVVPNIILGSQSKQRARILKYFCLPFIQQASDFDESSVDIVLPPEKYVMTLSLKKSEALKTFYSRELLITADTVVYNNGKIFNKPKNEEDALTMLSELIGKIHFVYTGMTVSYNDISFSHYQITELSMHGNISSVYLQKYIKTFQTLDKCGAYCIQDGGSIIISAVQGCYYNVQGLPINLTSQLLSKFGINLWDFIGS